MFYCILKFGSEYVIEDQANVKDPKVPWGEVRVKKGGSWEKAVFVNGGQLKAMEAEKKKYEKGELKPKDDKKKKPLVRNFLQKKCVK